MRFEKQVLVVSCAFVKSVCLKASYMMKEQILCTNTQLQHELLLASQQQQYPSSEANSIVRNIVLFVCWDYAVLLIIQLSWLGGSSTAIFRSSYIRVCVTRGRSVYKSWISQSRLSPDYCTHFQIMQLDAHQTQGKQRASVKTSRQSDRYRRARESDRECNFEF